MNYDNDKLLNIEGWSQSERNTSLARAYMISYLSVGVSGLLSIAPWIYFRELPSWLVVFVGAAGLLGLLTSLLAVYMF